jgi:hypothetical protein
MDWWHCGEQPGGAGIGEITAVWHKAGPILMQDVGDSSPDQPVA